MRKKSYPHSHFHFDCERWLLSLQSQVIRLVTSVEADGWPIRILQSLLVLIFRHTVLLCYFTQLGAIFRQTGKLANYDKGSLTASPQVVEGISLLLLSYFLLFLFFSFSL
ncbi:MAG: hypothetical protein J3R72DRAFT_451440 [Linnemannia gamsii]|nr:MAG: hypothetical protein J3R72DRAFT_451440 [Linnemannia gamsii]